MNYQKGSHISGDPPTPVTRVSIHPKHNHVIHCVLGFKNPIDVNTLKDELSNSVMVKIPRFLSLLVVDNNNGTEHWKKTDVNLDDHIFIHDDDDDDGEPPMSDDDAINAYLADIALSPPMSLDKPLWELHIMHKHKCSILRVHHAVADGMSLMSLLWTMGNNSSIRRVSDGKQLHHDAQNHPIVMSSNNDQSFRKKGSIKEMGLWEGLMYIWVSLVLVLKFIVRSLWVKDKKSVISGIEGVELWPRKIGGELFYNLFTHTSFLMSNIAGPLEPISLAANPITFIRITSSAQAHAFTLHMVSYAGKADLQIQVAKEVIPDPEFLATCIENALLEAKEAANARVTK